jgi:hypothetical protein
MEAELLPPIPRPVPVSLTQHPVRRARRASNRTFSVFLLVFSVLAWLFRDSSWMRNAALYFTPLGGLSWLCWIGVGLGVWGLFQWWTPWNKDPFNYLRNGIPVVGRVVDLRLEVAVKTNGAPTSFAYDAYFQFKDPATQTLSVARLRSQQVPASMAQLDRLRCRVGEYRTALYLPGEVAKSLTLYGFTGVNPDLDLIERKTAARASWKTLLWAIVVSGSMVAVFWGLSAYSLTHVDVHRLLTWLAPGACLGAILPWFAYTKRVRAEERNNLRAIQQGSTRTGSTYRRGSRLGQALLGAIAGTLLFGGILLTVNGMFDRSPGRSTTVEVGDTWCTTHNGLLKTYEVEYVDPETGKSEKLGISPMELKVHHGVGVLTVHPGALGFPWEEIHVHPRTEEAP